jgi:ATP-binding cassette subfamily B protein
MRVFVKAPLLIIGSLIMALSVNPGMAAVPAIIIPIVIVITAVNLALAYPRFRRVQKAVDRLNSTTREFLSGIRVVKAFNRSNYEEARFEQSNDELSDASMRVMWVMARFTPSVFLSVNIGIMAVLWYGGIRVHTGSITTGQVLAFVNYMTQILVSLIMLSFIFNMMVRAKASAERIGEVFCREEKMESNQHPLPLQEKISLIEFRNVTFSYPSSSESFFHRPVLQNISFSCRSGMTVGIIGSTGAGKSTLVSLLPRFYDPTSGSITIDGIDIRLADISQLRDKIAIVPQKSVLFTGTIAENIRWGNREASLEEVRQAAEIAQAHSFISEFPEGYDSIVGRGGVNLSGGQKQRISIARALVRKPQILILDDSTSALDAGTETRLRTALKNSISGMTCFIIAQRLASVLEADEILLLDEGKISGSGHHRDLLKSNHLYAELYHSQIGREVPDV